jgi:hypothetical protein
MEQAAKFFEKLSIGVTPHCNGNTLYRSIGLCPLVGTDLDRIGTSLITRLQQTGAFIQEQSMHLGHRKLIAKNLLPNTQSVTNPLCTLQLDRPHALLRSVSERGFCALFLGGCHPC